MVVRRAMREPKDYPAGRLKQTHERAVRNRGTKVWGNA